MADEAQPMTIPELIAKADEVVSRHVSPRVKLRVTDIEFDQAIERWIHEVQADTQTRVEAGIVELIERAADNPTGTEEEHRALKSVATKIKFRAYVIAGQDTAAQIEATIEEMRRESPERFERAARLAMITTLDIRSAWERCA